MLVVNKDKCTACGACMNACPKNCIKMTEGIDGFVHPDIDETNCVNCHICETVCPIGTTHDLNYIIEAYGTIIRDEKQLKKSTSGGAFSAIANYVLGQHGVVYGCAYDAEFKPVHIRIDSPDKLHYLNGSKYIQSDTRNTFALAKQDLQSGLVVLYSGTPCQVAGLKSFLGKEYHNLITVDIICHGVPSYAYFKKYLKWLEKTKDAKINRFQFRTKEKGGWNLSGSYSGVYLDTGKAFKKRLNYFDSYYYYYFLHSDIYRDCCYQCEYANLKRQGDFTLGDLWGAEGMKLGFNTDNGCSLLLINSSKSKMLLSKLRLDLKRISIEDAMMHNEQLVRPSKKSNIRNELLKQFEEWDAERINMFFRKENKKSLIKVRAKYIVPKHIKKVIQKIRYRWKNDSN